MSTAPNSLPSYDGSPRSISVLKAAAEELQKHVSFAAQARQLELWSRENVSRWPGTYSVSLDRKKWRRFVQSETAYTSRQDDLPKLAWTWLFEKYPHAIRPLWETMPDRHPTISNPVASALHGFLSPDEKSIDLDMLALLEGQYIVFRPSFLNPNDVMVMAMVCGIDGDPSRFSVVMTFENEVDDEPSTEHVEGFAIPYQDCILFQGRLAETGSPFVFVMSNFPIDPKTRKYSRADGTLLVGASGTMSSAYPITMRRSSKLLTPDTLSPERFQAEIRTHAEIAKFFNRGIVRWR